jgi:hypothetical protein
VLIECGADVDKPPKNPPLEIALKKGYFTVAKLLLMHGAKVIAPLLYYFICL